MPAPRRQAAGPTLPVLAVLLAAGLLSVGMIVAFAIPAPSPQPVAAASPSPAASAPGSAVPSSATTPRPALDAGAMWFPPTDPPDPPATEPPPTSTLRPVADGPTHRVATRVAVPALGIDLAVMAQTSSYPPCRVAMYLKALKQPGEGGVTYLYAHAQAGMFLPLLKESLVRDGRRMIGMTVLVWTGDNLRFSYEIREVRRHITTLTGAFRWRGESVFLQTSEGRGIPQKLQVVAPFVAVTESNHADAHPIPRPVRC